MKRARDLYLVAAVTAAIAASGLFASPASATTWTLDTSNGCSGGCTTGPFGSVTVTDGAGTLHFSVTLAGSYQFVGGVDAFAFNLSGGPAISFSNFTPGTFSGSNTTAGNFSMDGFGKFMYGVTAPGSGGSSPDGQSLAFDVTASGGLTLADLVKDLQANGDPGNYYFAVDLCPVAVGASVCSKDGNISLTGYAAGGRITNGGGQGEVPLPAALPLFGSVFGGGYFFSKWRRRKCRSVAPNLQGQTA
jgi:hypothetical protein